MEENPQWPRELNLSSQRSVNKACVSGSVCGTTVKYGCGGEVSLVFFCRTNAVFLLIHKDTYNLTPFSLRANIRSVVKNLASN